MASIFPKSAPSAPQLTPAAPVPPPQDNRAGIISAYQKYLNRTPGEADINAWMGNNDYEAGISGSPEAQQYGRVPTQTGPTTPSYTFTPTKAGATRQETPALTFADYERDYHAPDRNEVLYDMLYRDYWAPDRAQVLAKYKTGTSGTPPSSASSYAYMEGVDVNKLNDQTHTSPKYIAARILASGGSVAQAAQAVGGRVINETDFALPDGTIIDTRRDKNGANALQWLVTGNPNDAGAAAGPAAMGGQSLRGGGVTGTAGFTAPRGGTTTGVGTATGNAVFSDPATTEWEQALRATFDKLNQAQPTWTPAQMELQQTQSLDPLEQQRTARKQQAVEYYAARGQQPGHSGIVDQALMDIDRQFDQLRTTTQANFATQAINREDQVFTSNENRAVNATNLFKQIPQLADTRMASAQGTLQNPLQLIQTLMQQQNNQQNQSAYQNQQDQAFWARIANAFAEVFG